MPLDISKTAWARNILYTDVFLYKKIVQLGGKELIFIWRIWGLDMDKSHGLNMDKTFQKR